MDLGAGSITIAKFVVLVLTRRTLPNNIKTVNWLGSVERKLHFKPYLSKSPFKITSSLIEVLLKLTNLTNNV